LGIGNSGIRYWESGLFDPESRIPNPESRIPNPESRMKPPFRNTHFGAVATKTEALSDGALLYTTQIPLAPFPEKITARLEHWAATTPDTIFLARRANQIGEWQTLTYAETLVKVRAIAQFLLKKKLSADRTIAILSENSLEHALLALAALHVGVPYTPISTAYSLVSDDFGKLKHCLSLMTPGLVFAQDANVYARALACASSLFPDAAIITATDFSAIQQTKPTKKLEKAVEKVNKHTVAKVLFTSGSTGLPKGVINTHQMWCSNLQQIAQCFPFMQAEPPILVDWLPWNHTFGGNHNFGVTLYNGGTLYIDDGKPTPKGIQLTVKNLQEIAPTVYFNVPKGFEELIPHFKRDKALCEQFFSRLNMLFYAGASLPQAIWDGWEELSAETTGLRVPFITGLGCTESSPSALFAYWSGAYSGLLGVPMAGLDIKLVPDGDKIEARYRGANITPGYWRQPEATQKAFDTDGFYKTGDAVKFVDENMPDKGLVFDGRIAEDFKLKTGTWVNVGVLRGKIAAIGAPIVQDAVITGLDKDFVGAILFLNVEACRSFIGLDENASREHILTHPILKNHLQEKINQLAKTSTGSATKVARAIIAIAPPSIDLGEITDKGSLNQRMILKYRPDLVDVLYAPERTGEVMQAIKS
jgi:feruloyl-CoA synthase